MEYSASTVKYRFWFVETRETARLLAEYTPEEAQRIAYEGNLYQQKDKARIANEYGCIMRRMQAIPGRLSELLLSTDVSTAKLIVLISAMASDKLLFEIMQEVYRVKIRLGDDEWKGSDLNIFFGNKAEQSELIAGWTEGTVNKLKQVYTRFLVEAGLLCKVNSKVSRITKPYIDPELRGILMEESMAAYLYSLTGEN